ncbi:MAG: GAF domain-containing protein [Spirochaetia bacterium]|nr:GAF domain-containing protein [Spirochaetia bacterium]
MKNFFELLGKLSILAVAIAVPVVIFMVPDLKWWLPVLFAYSYVIVGSYLLINAMTSTVAFIFGIVIFIIAAMKGGANGIGPIPFIIEAAVITACYFAAKQIGDCNADQLRKESDRLKDYDGEYSQLIIEEKNLSTAVESARVKLEKFEKLKQIFDGIVSQPDFAGKMRHVLRNVINIFHAEKSIALFLIKENKIMKILADKQEDLMVGEKDLESLYLRNFDEFILKTRKSIIITDMMKEVRFKNDGEENMRSLISVPIFVKDDICGILRVSSDEPGCFNQEDLRFLDIIGGMISKILAEENYAG